jgi:hypothetical protein
LKGKAVASQPSLPQSLRPESVQAKRRQPSPHSPTLQSQFFSQSYESILPNSFTHILLCTRGYSPWKPEAVWSTPVCRKNFQKEVDPAIFKGREEMTEQAQNRTCFAEYLTHSLRKGISGIQAKLVKKKRRLFSVPLPPCRSLVALPR